VLKLDVFAATKLSTVAHDLVFLPVLNCGEAQVRSMAIRPIRTSFRSPWQNGLAEHWIESCRRDLLDYVIAPNEGHVKRLLSE
jgi:hypothetical protein